MIPKESKSIKNYIFLLGPILFFSTLLWPSTLEAQSQQFLAIFVLVIWLWIFTEVPLFISGILGVSLSILFGLVTPREALAPLADPIIYLFLSGFLFAKALEMTGLDEYLAHVILGHKKIQHSPKRIIFAFFFLSLFCSMWISNTASVAMLLPLTFGVLKSLKQNFGIDNPKLNETLLLGLAYSATIGGNLTPIGSPPNLISIGLLKNLEGKDFSFLQWMIMAIPISSIMFYVVYRKSISILPTQWKRLDNQTEFIEQTRELTYKQKNVLFLFGITILIWILPSIINLVIAKESSFYHFLKTNLSTATVGLFFSSLLFLFPLNKADKILTSHNISDIDWGSLLLFGTGLSLGSILFKTGLADIFANNLSLLSNMINPTSILLLFVLVTIFFTEIASNTASANIIIPIMLAFTQKEGLNPTVTAFAMAVACNSAFMLPVATPPNVIIYGTNQVKKISMIKAGWQLNLIGFVVIAVYVYIFNSF